MRLRNFVSAGLGPVGAQLVLLGCLPILARLYSPAEFAPWAFAQAVVVLVGSLSSLRYDLAVVTERDSLGGSALLWLITLVSFAIFGVVSLGLVTLSHMGLLSDSLRVGDGVGLTVLWLFLFVSSQIFMVWCQRNAAFFHLSLVQFANAAITSAVQIYGGMLLGGGTFWLVAGSIAGQFAALAILLIGSLGIGIRPLGLSKCYGHIKTMAWKHRRFLQYTLPYTIFGAIRERVPVLLVGSMAPGREFGLYSQAWRLTNVPAGLTGSVVRPVLFHGAAQNGLASIEAIVRRILIGLVALGVPLLAVLSAHPEEIFGWVLGDKWRAIGPYLAALIFPAFTFSLSNWMDRLVDIAEKQHLNLLAEMVSGISSTLALALVMVFGGGLLWAVKAQSLLLMLNQLFFIYLTYRAARYDIRILGLLVSLALGLFLATRLLLYWCWP